MYKLIFFSLKDKCLLIPMPQAPGIAGPLPFPLHQREAHRQEGQLVPVELLPRLQEVNREHLPLPPTLPYPQTVNILQLVWENTLIQQSLPCWKNISVRLYWQCMHLIRIELYTYNMINLFFFIKMKAFVFVEIKV